MAFDPGAWRRFRPSSFDLPMLGWCLCPLASGLANGLGAAGSVADSAYLSMAWGVPYLVGRLYFSHPAGLDVLARGIVGGRAGLPAALRSSSSSTGPVFYRCALRLPSLSDTTGMVRYVGYRPIVFLEHGNQLGTWLASSAMAAAWLWRSGQLRRFWGMPGGLVAAAAGGPVGALAVGRGGVPAGRRAWPRWRWSGGSTGPGRSSPSLVLLLAFVGGQGGEPVRRQGPGDADGPGPPAGRRLDPAGPPVVRLAAPGRGAGGPGRARNGPCWAGAAGTGGGPGPGGNAPGACSAWSWGCTALVGVVPPARLLRRRRSWRS